MHEPIDENHSTTQAQNSVFNTLYINQKPLMPYYKLVKNLTMKISLFHKMKRHDPDIKREHTNHFMVAKHTMPREVA